VTRKTFEDREDCIGTRIAELRKYHHWNQSDLAKQLHIARSQISRIENGETKNVNSDLLVALANLFHVSTDYLLGVTIVPAPKSYDISQLGLSEQAVANLLQKKADPEIVSRLLEHEKFSTLCLFINSYFRDSAALGIMARNDVIDMATGQMAAFLQYNPDQKGTVIPDINLLKTQRIAPSEADLERIRNLFMSILKDIKADMTADKPTSQTAVKEAMDAIYAKLHEKPMGDISADDVAAAVSSYLEMTGGITNQATLSMVQQTMKVILEQTDDSAKDVSSL